MPTTPNEPRPAPNDWMTVDEALAWLGFTTKREKELFRRAIRRGEVPAMILSNRTIKLHRATLTARYAA